MAREMTIRGTRAPVKIRSPWAAALLPIVTLGIYHLVWWYRINRELRVFGHAMEQNLGQSPTNSVLALFPGGLIVVPALITYWNGFKRVQLAAKLAGREQANGWIALILYLLLSPALWAYIQVSLNEIWEQEADGYRRAPTLGRWTERSYRRSSPRPASPATAPPRSGSGWRAAPVPTRR